MSDLAMDTASFHTPKLIAMTQTGTRHTRHSWVDGLTAGQSDLAARSRLVYVDASLRDGSCDGRLRWQVEKDMTSLGSSGCCPTGLLELPDA